MNLLIVIPARGGSKGIPRKNLRLLGGKPLIYYAIQTALSLEYKADIYTSSEDDEILNTALQFGSKVHKRDLNISGDSITLDPVIYDCYKYVQEVENKVYDFIITMQPTSPLLTSNSLHLAIEKMMNNKSIETMIAAKDNTHLSWKKEHNTYIPNYEKRLNRQELTPTFMETGAFFITKKEIITPQSRIGKHVDLFLLSGGEEIDIDTYEDWNLCEYHLKRKHILFVVTGNSKVGLGHVYNTLLVANDILNHKITFLVDSKSKMAYDKIASKNYPVFMQSEENILDDIRSLKADVVINDRLDTTLDYMNALKDMGLKTVNFEDLGEGAQISDLVINAIYPEKEILANHYFGVNYFVLRDEFIYAPQKKNVDKVKNILITFGGVDPNNYTKKVLESIYDYCTEHAINIKVIAGFGYDKYDTLNEYKLITIEKNVTNISRHMLETDLIFTSAGRTTYEVASLGVPTIVLAQNERELTHFFASEEYGFLNLGLGINIKVDSLYKEFKMLIGNNKRRAGMSKRMCEIDVKKGRKNVNNLIQKLLNE